MKTLIATFILASILFSIHADAHIYYCSTTGNDSDSGTIIHPFATWEKLWSVLSAGDTGYIRGGTYRTTKTADNAAFVRFQNKSGTSGNTIKVWAYPGETPVMNLDNVVPTATSTVFIMYISNCSYIHLKGLRATGLAQNSNGSNYTYGFYMEGGTGNMLENCESDHNCEGFSLPGVSNLLVLNCDAHHNQNPYSPTPYGGSNGFSSTGGQPSTVSITFTNCRSWWNSDDGVDLFSSDGTYTFNNCWSFWNGYIPGTFTPVGNGDGFKLGPTVTNLSTSVKHMLNNCLSFQNRFQGFDQNDGRCINQLYNCTSYGNGGIGYHFSYQSSLNIAHILKNNISFQDASAISSTPAWVQSNNTWNGITATTSSFASLTNTGVDGARQSNGALPNLQFLHLSASSNLIDAGVVVANIPYNGAAPDLGAFESATNVTGVTVSPTTAFIPVGGTQQLTATITPTNATNQNVTWSSSNTSIATVSSTGLVTAVAAGTATITVTTQDGAKTATSAITVSISVTGVAVSPTTASIPVGSTQQLTATITPTNATNQNVTWSSSNTSIATVSSTGLVTAVAAGTATITVTTQDGAKTATSAITVTQPSISVTGVAVSPTTASIPVGGTQQLTATITPTNATNQNVTWSSSNNSIATVNATGLVTAIAAGTATITVTTQDGAKTATSAITITQASVYYCSTTGNDSNPGTITQPFATWEKLWSVLSPGDTGYIRGGTYRTTKTAGNTAFVRFQNKSGTSGNTIKVWAYPGEVPIMNLDNVVPTGTPTVFIMYISNCSYVHLKGLRATGLAQNSNGSNYTYGFYMEGGTGNILENCESDHNCEGFALSGVSNLLVLNCDAHHNQNPYSPTPYGGSNGFSSTGGQPSTVSITFTNCRSWWNSNEGVNLYNSDGTYTFNNCWSFWNGYRPGTFTPAGSGDGFGLGPTVSNLSTSVKRILNNCISFQNKLQGFNQNDGRCINQLYNCTSYGNAGTGYYFSYQSALNIAHVLKNNISFQDASAISSTPAWVQSNNTWNGITATTSSFASLTNTGVDGARQSNGALPNLQFLHLSTNSNLINAGVVVPNIPYSGTAPDLGAFEFTGSGLLTGSGLASSAMVNLTTEGTADWAHWYGYDHKASGGSKISNYTVVGTGSVLNYTNDPRTCTWSDGTPAASGSNQNGIYITGTGKGFQITAPADLTQRTLKVYVGGWTSSGTLTASLSDGSAANYVNSSFSGTSQYNAVYTLTYKAASANKLLTVKWVQASGSGNVNLQAATLAINPARVINNNSSAVTGNSNMLMSSNNMLITGKRLSIYPNPFDDAFVVRYSGKELGHGRLSIYTLDMRLVATYPFEKTSFNMNQRFFVNGLTNGFYIVEYQIGDTKLFTRQLRLR